jgi:hypothetical protein
LDIEDNEVARRVHKLMMRRSLKEFSIGYDAIGERTAADGANELTEVDLVEAGPTLKGANPSTELLDVKSALGITDDPAPSRPRRKRTSAVSDSALRAKARDLGLVIPSTATQLRRDSEQAHEEYVARPGRALRRRSEEQALDAATGGRKLPLAAPEANDGDERAVRSKAYAAMRDLLIRT